MVTQKESDDTGARSVKPGLCRHVCCLKVTFQKIKDSPCGNTSETYDLEATGVKGVKFRGKVFCFLWKI